MKKAFLLFSLLITLTTHADILGEYSFVGTLGDKIQVELRFAVDGNEIAIGEVYYPKAKNPAPILIVGQPTVDGWYYMREFQSDGTVTGILSFKIEGEDTADGPHISEGTWSNPKTGKELPMKHFELVSTSVDVPKYFDYEDPQNIGREYAYSIWNPRYNSMMGGNVLFRGAGKYKLHFEVSNCPGNMAEGKSAPDRPAVLGETTHDWFNYENVNDCGYSFSAYFFKKFVVLKTISGPDTVGCFGNGVTFDGVYIKVRQ